MTVAELRQRREALAGQLRAITTRAESEGRGLHASEERKRGELRSQIVECDERITEVTETEERDARAAAVNQPVNGNDAGLTYRQAGEHSYFRDLASLAVGRADTGAMQRLTQHREQVERAASLHNRPELRALSTTDGAGGEFVPPLWLVDQYVELARPSRAGANLFTRHNLPSGTDSVNLPRIATGTTVAAQAAQGDGASNTTATTDSVTGPVRTFAGIQISSLQVLEQSPASFDQVIYRDLIGDYNKKLDTAAISGDGTSGTFTGLLSTSGINTVTYTDAAPTVAALYPPLAQAVSQVASNVFRAPSAILMHPRRWFWIMAALDTSDRPLVTPSGQSFNAVATADGGAEGRAGELLGLPVYIDANIPTNLGGGTDEDRIIVAAFDEVYLYEGAMRTEAFRETKSDTLQVLFRVYNYAALIADRRPKAISVVAGTGLVAPSGF